MTAIKNVILLTIDTLSFKSIALNYQTGNHLNVSPFLTGLMNKNMCLTNHFSAGCPTQMSFPSIMTSTLPLDYGGYEAGIKDRPTSLAEVLNDVGYRTVAFVSGNGTQEFFYYNRGFDEFYSFADLSLATKSFSRSVNFYRKRELSKTKINYLSTHVESFLDYCLYYSLSKTLEIKNSSLSISRYAHAWDFFGLSQYIEQEKIKLKVNQEIYIVKLIQGHIFKLQKEILSYRKYNKKLFRFDKNSISRIKLNYMISNVMSKNAGKIRFLFHSLINLLRSIKHAFYINYNKNIFESGYNLVSNAVNWIQRNRKKSFFLWLHISDLHENEIYSNFDNSEAVENELRVNLELVKRLKDSNVDENLRNKLSLRLNDSIIESLFNNLKSLSLLEETLIVITSDHGSKSSGLSSRNYDRSDRELALGYGSSLHSTDFYDELYHIPAIFIHPSLNKSQIKGMTSSIDISPTILNILDIDVPDEFKGKNILNETSDFVIMENLGPGPADFDLKPIKLAIRNRKFKLVAEEIENKEIIITAVYNILDDSCERNNILYQVMESEEIVYLHRVLIARYEDLRFNEKRH